MDEKKASKAVTKLITRSKTKTSKSHKKIVTMLNNLSKDKTGAPVKWKFNKSGIKQANKVGKRLATAQVKDTLSDKTVEQSSNITQKKETKSSESIKKSQDKDITVKRKPGRPKTVKQEHIDSIKTESQSDDEDEETELTPLNSDSDIQTNKTLSDTTEDNSYKVGRGRKKTVLSKDIRIKRLQILKRHMEKGRGRGRGKVKRIAEYHTTPDNKSESNKMNSQSTVNINQDKLKMLKEQIDIERRRGRGKGMIRRGRGRLLKEEDLSETSNQMKDSNDMSKLTDTNHLEILKRQIGRGTSHRGRRGRPKWKNLNVGTRSNESDVSYHGDAHHENRNTGTRRPRRGRGSTWTSLNRQTLSRTVLDQHTKEAVSSGNFPLVNETFVDSENESIDSNLSNASSKVRKRKMFQHLGIKLGPAKLLRSQDSMKTRNYKDAQNQHVAKKRKRTLSGEFELLDEVSLRKKMRGKDDDDTSTVKSFDDSWADVTDSELNDSQVDVLNIDTENKLIKSKSKKVKAQASVTKSRESSIEMENKTVRRKGRPPKILSEEYETTVITKKKKEKGVFNTKTKFVRGNSDRRLAIIGPGGKYFVKIQKGTDMNDGNQVFDVGLPELKTDEVYDDAKTSDLKDEVIIQDIEDESIKENEVVINVVIENSGEEEPVDTKFSQVKDNLGKDENDISKSEVQNDINNQTRYSSEIEISQETILKSMKQVKSNEQSETDITETKVTYIEQEQDKAKSTMEIGKQPIEGSVMSVEDKPIVTSTTESKTETLSDSISTIPTQDEKLDTNTIDALIHNNHSEKLENSTVEKSEMLDTSSSENITDVTSDITSKEICDVINQSETSLKVRNESLTQSEKSSDKTSTDVGQTDSREKSVEPINNVESRTRPVSKMSLEETGNEELENIIVSENTESINADVTDILDHIISSVCQNYESEIPQNNQTLKETTETMETINDNTKPELSGSDADFVESSSNTEAGQEIRSSQVESEELVINQDVKVTDALDNNSKLDKENSENTDQMDSEKDIKISEQDESSHPTELSNELETFTGTNDNTELNNTGKDSTNNKEEEGLKLSDETMAEKQDEITSEIVPQESADVNVNLNDGTKETCLKSISNNDEKNSSDGDSIQTKEETSTESQVNQSQTKQIGQKESDLNSKPGNEESDIHETPAMTPETSGKTEKRVFQLRKKASRSPLEIIAMKHSMEERQYMLEETQRAIRREEKQKKMFQNKMMRQTIEQLSPSKQSPPKPPSELPESTPPDKSDVNIQDSTSICRPCSVVLIDFVKYLKMNDQSEKSGSVTDGDSTEEDMTEDESNEKSETSIVIDTGLSQPQGETDSVSKLIPLQLKRPAKARKQAKSYNYSSTLTAEIVSSPEPTDNGSKTFTVPPLRLKIKQKADKGKKRFKGHKWAAPRNKARKQMSPVKRLLSNQKFEFETLGSKNIYDFEDEPSKIRKLDDISSDTAMNTPNLGTLSVDNANLSVQANRREQQETYRFKCNEKDCEFKSQMRNVMESHIYIHLKDTPFKCSNCDLIFSTRNLAFNHSKGTHPEKDAKIVAVNSVDESKYYEEIDVPQGSDNSNVIQADIADVQHSSESLIISVRLPRNMTENTTACYCCSHCEYYSSKIQDINAHVEEKHRELIQYNCSVCNKAVYRHGEGIARHFSLEHPEQPVAYKSLPDFYDVRKTIEKSSANGDKGNIFDRMSDLFAGKKTSEKSKSIPEKTSAEADSTTAETDEDIAAAQKDTNGSEKSVATVPRVPDGIEQLAQMFGPPTSGDATSDRSVNEGDKNNQVIDETSGNDMGLKIVDVVSLQGGSDFAKNVWGESAPVSKSVPPYSNQLPSQVVHRPPVLIPTGSVRQHLQPTHHRPILPMPPQSEIDAAKLKTTTTTYKCEKCNVHAPILSAMVEHLRTGHKDIPRLFLCPYCRQYEGATEPDIHKHIKQFHPSPDTRSPPVALSSDAKQHLRTIEVPIGDTPKVNGKYLIEKNIYKCLKCKRHMPSLDYIYEHLEKEHNEVFVYVCPDCKLFRAKEEEVVFNHIKTVHNKNTDDIILSLAIEENLFTKVQCLIKDKSSQNKTNLQKPPPLVTPAVQIRHDTSVIQQQRHQVMMNYQQRPQPLRPPMQPVFPGMIQNQPVRMPGPIQVLSHPGPIQVSSQSHPMHLQSTTRPQFQNQPLNKSAMRKSRPVHIPQQHSVDHVPTSHTIQHLPSEGRQMSSPPPLMRGPPPLIRFQGNHGTSQPHSEQSIRSANFAMSDKVHRLQPHPQGHPVSSPPPNNRPVLKVPSVQRRTANASPIVSEGRTTLGGSPLDLSRNSTPNSQPDISDDTDDVSPDAFQIFNLQPARQMAPQVHPNRYSQQVHNIAPQQRLQQMGQFNMYNRPAMYPSMYNNRPPPPYSQAIHPQSPPHQPALFKCPYCSPVVPLSMGEVAPHIKKYHPGQTVRFVKKD